MGGVGLVRGGAGTALVGDPETVAARIREYADLGIDTFILSGYPHLEEAYNVAELLLPLLDTVPAALPPERSLQAKSEAIGYRVRNEVRDAQSHAPTQAA